MKRQKSMRILITAAIVCGLAADLAPSFGAAEPWRPAGKESSVTLQARTSPINRPKEVGTYYEATVPDTLDLAERARYGINHFTSIISEKDDFEMYWRGDFDTPDTWAWPGHMWFQSSSLFACQAKSMEALAMERLMSGSQQNLELEARMLEMMMSRLGDDGIYYILSAQGRKPWLGPEEYRPYASVHGQGRMMRAMVAWYQYTGNPAWRERIDRMVDGWDRLMVVHQDDYAYFPIQGMMEEEYMRSCYVKGQGWKSTGEPLDEKGGEEGSLFNHQGHILGVLANWYKLTGNKQALRLAGELARFLTKPKFWANWKKGDYPGVVGAEHAHWYGHFHGHINTLRAILEYADAVGDARLRAFVREGYEWGRQVGLARIGLVGDGQGCGCGRLIGLAIKLSEAGVGDYWEDVDLYIRNHGTEAQFTPEDVPYLERLLAKHPNPPAPPEMYSLFNLQRKYPQGLPAGVEAQRAVGTNAGALAAAIGAFTIQYPPYKVGWALCCSPHGNMGIFYAWDAALRYQDGVVRVNLLLNRASPWMNVDSYIPYEGKVVLKNKEAREVFVRIPLYVDQKTVRCRVGLRELRPEWFGRYLQVGNLKTGDVVRIEFPLNEWTERWSVPPAQTGFSSLPLPAGAVYTIKFRGNTVIELTPPLAPGTWLYQDRPAKYRAPEAPMRQVTRYDSPTPLAW